jgi:hypothetical protein
MFVKCAECQCIPQDCTKVLDAQQRCILCTKDVCCCDTIHSRYYPTLKKPMATSETRTALETDVCCSSFPSGSSCKKNDYALQHKVTTTSSQSSSSSSSGLYQFLRNINGLYSAALGIKILCIAAAEIGENTGLYLFGFNLVGYL